jgi:penicillin V acylase-like amidase (Ntn superfamily)
MLPLLLVFGCSDFMMSDEYGLSVRTMDLGFGPTFGLKTQPRGHALAGLAPAKYGHIISVGANVSTKAYPLPAGMAFAGLNEAGLSCDLHSLLNSSYPPPSHSAKDLDLYLACNWALAGFARVADVKAALVAGDVHLWGPAGWGQDGVHFILRDASGVGLAVEFLDGAMVLHDDLNDGETGYGVFTNEPPFAWQLANVKHYLWKQSLARPSTAMPGAWYPDERFLRIFLTKSAMPPPASYQQAVQHALHVLNTITVPMGLQMGTDSGYGEGAADHTHYGHVYDHKNAILYWRTQSNLQLQRVRLADLRLLAGAPPMALSLFNSLPWFHDAAHAFA